jgi:VCBS repeat-containing protein
VPENSANGTIVGTVTFTDPDAGQSHTFAITAGNTGGAFAITATTGQITVANSEGLGFETTPTFTLTVRVTDNGTPPLSGSAIITVNLTNVNKEPVANAGPDQTVVVFEATTVIAPTVTLDGRGSHDIDGDPLTFAWTFTTRPARSTATLINPTSATPTFVPDAFGIYVVQLIVNDGTVDSAPDTVNVTVVGGPE